jgi:hypothetical protein
MINSVIVKGGQLSGGLILIRTWDEYGGFKMIN